MAKEGCGIYGMLLTAAQRAPLPVRPTWAACRVQVACLMSRYVATQTKTNSKKYPPSNMPIVRIVILSSVTM